MEILIQIHSLFGHIDQAYLNAAKVGGWVVGIIAAVTYVVRQMIKVVAGVTKIKEHFEANQLFREDTAKTLDELMTGQAIGQEISKMVISKTGSFFFRTNEHGDTIEVGEDLTAATGYTFSQVANRGWINYVHPDDRQMVSKAVDDTVESKSDWDLNFRYNIQGTYQNVRSEARKVLVKGKIVNYVGTITPIHVN